MQDAGTALMGIGRASGENRAQEAARAAINSPLLEMTIDGAKGVLFNITGGANLGMFEIDEAAKVITKSIDSDAKVKFGAVIDDSMGDEVRITVIATGFDESSKRPTPAAMVLNSDAAKPKMPEVRPTPPLIIPPQEPRKPMFNPKPAPPIEIMGPDSMPEQGSEDELDIPAFIRKKMK
jgi:cell division protein FtsZ